MQSKLVIAALIGTASTKDLERIKHAIVQSIQSDFSKSLHDIESTMNHGLEDTEDAIGELSHIADNYINDVEVSLGVKPVLRSAADIKKIEGIIGGILKGAVKAEGFDDINSCISDAEIIFQDAEEAFMDFETKDVTKIADGIGKLADLLEHVMAGMKDCSHVKADWTSVVKMIEAFNSPTSFVIHIGTDLLINGKDIFSEIEDAIDSYKKENWEQFGIDVGMAAAKTLLGGEEEPKVLSKLESDEKLEQIVAGILEGALEAEGFDDINSCIQDNELVFQDAEEAYMDFTTKDFKKIAEGVKKVADLLTHVKTGMSDCSHLKADWEKLEKMSDIFQSPKSFAFHVGKDLLINGKDIFTEISDAIGAYKKQDWKKFGVDIGTAAAKTILGEEEPVVLGSEEKMKLAQIEQGILKSYGGKFDLYALLECIGDEDKSLLMLDMAVQQFQSAFKQKNPSDAIAGIIATIAAVQQFKAGLPECKAIDTSAFDFKLLDASYDIAAHPTKHFELMEEDLLLNGVPLKRNVRKALRAYRKGEFVDFGYKLGSILQLATETVEETSPVETSVKVEESLENVHDRKMVAEVAQGFLSATQVGDFNFTNLLVCIFEADQSALALYSAIDTLEKAYKDKDLNEAVVGIVSVIAFVQQLKQSIPTCEAIDQRSMDWSHFNNIVDVVESPEKHMQLIENDIMFNDIVITSELSQVLDAFRSENYNEFGYKLGNIMYLATEAPANLGLY